MRLLRRFFTELKLRVNESKSAVDLAAHRKILGYSFWVAPGRVVKRRLSRKALQVMKDRVRLITKRTRGRSVAVVADELRGFRVGWKEYYRLADTPDIFSDLDEWIRHRPAYAPREAVEAWHDDLSEAMRPRDVGTLRGKGGGQRLTLVDKFHQGHPPCASDTQLRPARSPTAGCITFYFLNRPVRIRMSGGVAGVVGDYPAPYAGLQCVTEIHSHLQHEMLHQTVNFSPTW